MTRTTQKNVRLMARMTDYPITKWYSRTFTLLNNAISFEGGEPSDGYGIPTAIYGCKAMSVPIQTYNPPEDITLPKGTPVNYKIKGDGLYLFMRKDGYTAWSWLVISNNTIDEWRISGDDKTTKCY